MKKLNLIICAFLILGGGITKAQYNNVILNFDSGNGEHPNGSLTFYANKLYGMTSQGGAHDVGCIFRIDTDGTGYQDLYDFNDTTGAYPYGDLTISVNKMYGMTSEYGLMGNGFGNVFSIDTNGRGYKELYDFGDTNGFPEGNLTLAGNKLYGMTRAAWYGNGNIFSIDTNGSGYKDLFDFYDSVGINPYGSLTLSGSKLFGMTSELGKNTLYSDGTIFSIDTNGSGFTDMFNFNDTNGGNPFGNLTLSRSKLYGMTHWAGSDSSRGCIFSINTNGSGFSHLHYFPSFNSGAYPTGSLSLSGSIMYGFANGGGGLNNGCIFRIDTSGNGYRELFYFEGWNGGGLSGAVNTRWGTLINRGRNLFGMTLNGGTHNYGVIFSIDTSSIASINNLNATGEVINIFPNPSSGIFTLSLSNVNARPDESFGREKCNVEIYNMVGEKVMFATPQYLRDDNRIDLSNQPNGVYFYRVVSETGRMIGVGKLIIEK